MPFYRVNGMMVHLNMGRMKRPPAQCRATLELDGKMVMCCGISAYLCDHGAREGNTCDMPLCEEHKGQVGTNKNLCPKHMAERNPIKKRRKGYRVVKRMEPCGLAHDGLQFGWGAITIGVELALVCRTGAQHAET